MLIFNYIPAVRNIVNMIHNHIFDVEEHIFDMEDKIVWLYIVFLPPNINIFICTKTML